MSTNYQPLIVLAVSLQLCLTSSLEATEISFTVDPTSSLTMSANFSGFNLVEQGPGSLTTTYSGTLIVDVDDVLAPASIGFLSSALVAADSGSWLPEVEGGPSGGNKGTAQPANYGGLASTGFLVAGKVYAALRNFELDTATPNGPLAVVSGNFPSTQIFTITTGTIDFNIAGGLLVGGDAQTDDLSTDSIVNQASASTYSSVGSLITLTLPIDTDIDINNGDGTANISGTLIATAMISFAPGDYDKNGTVDLSDYAVWQSNFGSTTQLSADGNGDNIVNSADYTIWRDSLSGATNSETETTSIPEPGTLFLAPAYLWLLHLGAKRERN